MEQKLIINKLIDRPVTEREQGYNDALISLLKELQEESERSKLKRALGNTWYGLSDFHISDLIRCKRMGHKLEAVKLLKDGTGLGLKEAKDLLDVFFNL